LTARAGSTSLSTDPATGHLGFGGAENLAAGRWVWVIGSSHHPMVFLALAREMQIPSGKDFDACRLSGAAFRSTGLAIKFWARVDRIQEGPVALFHLEAFGKWRPRFHAQRPLDPVVAIVALRDDADQVR
jgi:hypothetical protein